MGDISYLSYIFPQYAFNINGVTQYTTPQLFGGADAGYMGPGLGTPLYSFNINGVPQYVYPSLLSYYAGGAGTSANTGTVAPTPVPPHFSFTFDTIGQTIFRSIGHCRLPLRTIWAQGINESGDTSTSSTRTFAAALCAPIDPLENGEIFAIWDGGSLIFNSNQPVKPQGWSPQDFALLQASLANAVLYPGDEAQLPASLIVADKGADKTNAFRGLRYIILPDYPIGGGGQTSGIPKISIGFKRTNQADDSIAVEFTAGSG